MLLDFRRLGKFDFSKAETYADYAATLPPPGCVLHELGESSDPSKLVYGVSVGSLDGSKPVLYLQAQIHGAHEWRGAHYLAEFMRHVANPQDSPLQEFLIELTQNFDIYAIPCVNPYGYEAETYENANGVNLNRNFDYNFSDSGSGTAPFSEPETQYIKQVVEQYRPILFADFHTLGGELGTVVAGGSEDNAPYRKIVEEMRQTLVYNIPVIPARNNGPSPAPTSRSWASNQDSINGRKTIGFLFECGSLETGETQCTMSIYAAYAICAYALNYYKYGTMEIAENFLS